MGGDILSKKCWFIKFRGFEKLYLLAVLICVFLSRHVWHCSPYQPGYDRKRPQKRISDTSAKEALLMMGRELRLKNDKSKIQRQASICKLAKYGVGYGMHEICNISSTIPKPCRTISVGINWDHSFDADLYRLHGCEGVALDPSLTHPSILNGTKTRFMQIGLNMPKHLPFGKSWEVLSLPILRQALNMKYVTVFKMDCEGCEYSLYQDLQQARFLNFFESVDHVALEIHSYSKFAISGSVALDLGRLYKLLEISGHQLVSATLAPCGPSSGYRCDNPIFLETDYPCERSGCQNLAFVRKPALQQ